MLPAGITRSTWLETILQHSCLAARRLASSKRFPEFAGSDGSRDSRIIFLERDGS